MRNGYLRRHCDEIAKRGIVGNIVSRFETKGYKLCAMKTKQATKDLLEEHYKDLVSKPFFPKLRDYVSDRSTRGALANRRAIWWRAMQAAFSPRRCTQENRWPWAVSKDQSSA